MEKRIDEWKMPVGKEIDDLEDLHRSIKDSIKRGQEALEILRAEVAEMERNQNEIK